MSTKLLTTPRSVVPGSLGHHWDSRMRAASIKLVQAGQASVCYTSCLLSNDSAGWTHTQRGAACHRLHFDDTNRKRDKQEWWTEGAGDGGVREIVITKADNVSVLPLCTVSAYTSGEVFEEKDSINHATLCPIRLCR